MKDLNITAPEGYEIDLENSDLAQGVIKFKEKSSELVKSWEDLETIEGYYIGISCFVESTNYKPFSENRNTWATKEQAGASIAMAMLSQLMKQANGDWTPDWSNYQSVKYCLVYVDSSIEHYGSYTEQYFLTFKSPEIRDEFLELHKDLIEKAKPLL